MRRRGVLDASAAVHVVCGLPAGKNLLEVLANTAVVMAPDLYVSEVASTLWKYVRHDSLQSEDASDRLGDARRLVDLRVSDDELVEEALVAAVAYGHPVYDMLYAVLARRHGAEVITMDQRLTSALKRMEIGFVLGES